MRKRYLYSLIFVSFIIDFSCFFNLSFHKVSEKTPPAGLYLRRVRKDVITVEKIVSATHSLGWDEEDARALLELEKRTGKPLAKLLMEMISLEGILRPSEVYRKGENAKPTPSIENFYSLNDWEVIFSAIGLLGYPHKQNTEIVFYQDEKGISSLRFDIPNPSLLTEKEKFLIDWFLAYQMANHLVCFGGKLIYLSNIENWHNGKSLREEIEERFFETKSDKNYIARAFVVFKDGRVLEEKISLSELNSQHFAHRLAGKISSPGEIERIYISLPAKDEFSAEENLGLYTQEVKLFREHPLFRDIPLQRLPSFNLLRDVYLKYYYEGELIQFLNQPLEANFPAQESYSSFEEYPEGVILAIDIGGTNIKALKLENGKITGITFIPSWAKRENVSMEEVLNDYLGTVIKNLGIDGKELKAVKISWPGQVNKGRIAAPSAASRAINLNFEELRDFGERVRKFVNEKMGGKLSERDVLVEHDNRAYWGAVRKLVKRVKNEETLILVLGSTLSAAYALKGELFHWIGQVNQMVLDMLAPPSTFSPLWQSPQVGPAYVSGDGLARIAREKGLTQVKEGKDVASFYLSGTPQEKKLAEEAMEAVGKLLALSLIEFNKIYPVKNIILAGGAVGDPTGEIILKSARRTYAELKEKRPDLKGEIYLLKEFEKEFPDLGLDKLDLTKLDPLGQLGTGEMTPGKLLQEFLGALGIGFLRRNPTPGK